jgi:hypothetical protein
MDQVQHESPQISDRSVSDICRRTSANRELTALCIEAEMVAMTALAVAAQLPHGDARTFAMRRAGQLQLIADAQRLRLETEQLTGSVGNKPRNGWFPCPKTE